MNRRHLLLPLLLVAIPALSQPAHPTVVVLDQSYSMSLPAGESTTRTSLLLDALEIRIAAQENQDQFALIAFDDVDAIRLLVPYPAPSAVILSAARDSIPWGTSPIITATRFALSYAAELLKSASGPMESVEIILVTDGEDDVAYMSGDWLDDPSAIDLPTELASDAVKLTVITSGFDHPGATSILPSWALQSGGEVVSVLQNGERSAERWAGSRVGIDHEVSSGGGVSPRSPETSHRTGFAQVLAAWLRVVRWNLAVSAVLGIIVFVMALHRWSGRAAAVTRHNALPTQVVLDVRTSLRRRSFTFTRFPITVGTRPESTLPLTNGNSGDQQTFELDLADEGLLFSTEEKLNVNGVPRQSWQLHEGDQIRLGRYRISFEALVTTTPVPPPPQTHWRAAILPAFSVVAAVLLFVFQPSAVARSVPPLPGLPTATRPTDGGPTLDSDSGPTTQAGARDPSLPTLYGPGDSIRYFDADYLVVHAHPDDETLDYGVLLARLDAAGLQGVVVLLTDGQSGRDQYPRRDTGGIYPAYDLAGDELAAARIAEARNAMGHLGVETYIRGRLSNFPYNTSADQLSVSQVLDRWGGLWAIVDALAEVIVGFTPELVISPDVPRGPYEHFEHEATGVIVATLLDSLNTAAMSTVRAHLLGIDPLQAFHYDKLVEISPWDLNPATGVSYRAVQMRALSEHKTQRDSSVEGIETRLAVPAEYYAVGFWDPTFQPPDGLGIEIDPIALSRMEMPSRM